MDRESTRDDRVITRDKESVDCADRKRDPAVRDPAERPEPSRDRKPDLYRGHYRISQAEQDTMIQIGKFRTVAVEDLAQVQYKGRTGEMHQDLRSLAAQGLVQRKTGWTVIPKGKITVAGLTEEGKELLDGAQAVRRDQVLYAGFVKPAEVAHDAAIYRMYQAEAAEIQKQSGKVRRVVLDYELKRKVYSPLAKAKGLRPLEYARRQREVARENGLKVIHGKIPLPDLRIEYETREGELARVDLELATSHYHGSHLEEKAEAGFKMYAGHESASRLSRVLDEREITATIFSL